MSTPTWLHALALAIWGASLGLGLKGLILGSVLAGLRLLATGPARLKFGERELRRSADLTAVLLVLILAGLLAAQGLPRGLLAAMGLMPAALLPLLLIASINESPLRLRHLALSLRDSGRPEAELSVNPNPTYLAITLLATSVQARPSNWVLAALGGTIVVWLFVARPVTLRRSRVAFAIAALLALGAGVAGSQGLQRAQLALQEWVIDALSGVDSDPYQSQTRIGDIGRVKLSDRIVWRVRQSPPVEVPLLLRSSVFSHYVNGIWVARRDTFQPLPDSAVATPPGLNLLGDGQDGVVLLPMPAGFGGIDAPGRLERNSLGVVRLSDAPALLEVALDREPASKVTPSTRDLELPPDFADLLSRLPEITAMKRGTAAERLAALESWFGEHFRYTLFVGDETRGRRSLEQFLLTDRAAHCEYFATATVLLLRALGIPARYVTGYSVQEYSRLEGAFVVRKRHAHAWVEAFIDQRWIEVDTTPATWLGVEENGASVWQPVLDVFSWAWRHLGEYRRDLFSGDHSLGAQLAGAMLLMLAAVWLLRKRWQFWRRPAQKVGAGDTAFAAPSAEQRSFFALERELAALGLARLPGETPRNWLRRLDREGRSVVNPEQLNSARELIDALYRQRYALIG
ncbi:MAG: hypothetical protein K9J74_02720 [Sulfuritalea sp.]|nr:hypothetical protein [Sulfuritalea sp.]